MNILIVGKNIYYTDIKRDPGSGVISKHEQHQLTCTTQKQMKHSARNCKNCFSLLRLSDRAQVHKINFSNMSGISLGL